MEFHNPREKQIVNMSTELESNNEVVLDDDLVEIRKKNESVITRNLGNPKPRARKMKAFETVVWPALEKIGWRKVSLGTVQLKKILPILSTHLTKLEQLRNQGNYSWILASLSSFHPT